MALAALPPEVAYSADLLHTLLDGSATGIIHFYPVYAAGEELVELTYGRLNPAAQRLLQLPEYPNQGLLGPAPGAKATAAFAFYQATFCAGHAGQRTTQYLVKGAEQTFHEVAQRQGEELVVSLTAVEEPPAAGSPYPDLPAAPGELVDLAAPYKALADVFAQAPVAMAVLRGPRYLVELANPAVCALWGRTLAETLHRPIFEVLPEAAGQGFEQLLDGVLATGVPHVAIEQPSFIDRHGRRDTVYWTLVYHPLREADGRITGITVVATEVSEQVLARQGLAAYQQLQAVLEQAPVAVGVFTGPEHRVAVCNPGMQAIWGRTAAQVLHQPLFEVLPESHPPSMAAALAQVLRTGVPHVAHETPLQVQLPGQAHATTIYVNCVYHPLRDVQGQITAIAAVATDVSAQVSARRLVQQLNVTNVRRLDTALALSHAELLTSHDELSTANQLLTRTNVDLDNFIYTASHDLRAPISNIEGLLHALLVELPTDVQQAKEVQPLLGMMQGAIERFQLTIAQLTDLVRLQQAHAQPLETTDVAAVVEAVWLDLLPLVTATGAQFSVEVTTRATQCFSAKNLRSLVYNLLSNALKYHHPDRVPLITLRCHQQGEKVVLAVADNGLGLTLAQQQRVFGMFQRLHTHVEGSGIGLYMVKKIVENAGGTIQVTSQPGVGTTFTVSLPGG